MGLNGYDFMLTIEPLFNVTVLPPRGGNSSSTVVIVEVTRFGESGSDSAVINATVSLQYLIATTSGNGINEVIQGDAAASTNASGYAKITINAPYSSNNFYYFDAFASLDGYGGDHGYYTTAAQAPLLMAMILPFTSSYNNITFIDPHLLTNCLLNSGEISNPGQSALGLRIAAVYKSIYGYTFNSINFTLNPGKGSKSYPIPCTVLQSLQSSHGNGGQKYSACYWSLPTTPLFLVVSVYRNSNGQSGSVPLHEILLIPYGISPQYYLSNREIVFGKSVSNAPTGTASSLVQIGGDSTYTAKIVLYYDGDFLAG